MLSTLLAISIFAGSQGCLGTGGAAPFWAITGTHDAVAASNGASVYVGAYGTAGKTFKFNYGTDLVFRTAYDGTPEFFPDEAYIGAEWLVFKADVGIRHKKLDFTSSLGPLTVTSGNMLNSGNARTIPGITLQLLPLTIPFTAGRVRILGTFGDYRTLDTRYIAGSLIHNTEGYMQIDITRRLTFTLGLDHYAEWGGVSPTAGVMSTEWPEYLSMLVGGKARPEASGYYEGDKTNTIGNQLGRELLRFDYRADDWTLTVQHDIPYEDRSGMTFHNIPDGTNTICFSLNDKTGWISDIVYEHQYTLDQSGESERRLATQEEIDRGKMLYYDGSRYWYIIGGGDCYFNNSEYRTGWTYYGRCIGSPLLFTNGNMNGVDTRIISNMVKAHHIGIAGNLFRRIPYRLLCTYSLSYGQINSKFTDGPRPQFSAGFECSIPLGKLQIKPAVYLDRGQMLPNNVAATLGLRYNIR